MTPDFLVLIGQEKFELRVNASNSQTLNWHSALEAQNSIRFFLVRTLRSHETENSLQSLNVFASKKE